MRQCGQQQLPGISGEAELMRQKQILFLPVALDATGGCKASCIGMRTSNAQQHAAIAVLKGFLLT